MSTPAYGTTTNVLTGLARLYLAPANTPMPPASNATLTTALVSGTPVTALAVTALTAPIASGANVVITSGSNTETFVTTASAAVGATSVAVTSLAPNFSYPVGTVVDSLPYGTAWPSPWVASGFTETGVVMNVDRKVTNVIVEEQSSPIDELVDTTDVSFDVSFAEDTLQNMLYAYGGGAIVVTGGVSTLTLSDSLTHLAVGFESVSTAASATRRVYVPDMVSAGKVKTSYMRFKGPRVYPATFSAVCPVESILTYEL